MKIALYDVDSAIPNLAIMKLSAFHKREGDEVFKYIPLLHSTYDRIYASKVFKFSDGSRITEDMISGGTGLDLKTELPEEIDRMVPDYSFYDFPHSIGFTMRGCRFDCSFCVVPRKEGRPYSSNTIEEIWTQRDSKFLILLDNDFFGNPEWKDRIEEIIRLKLRVNFSQGLNIRIISERQAQALSKVHFRSLSGKTKLITFAWVRPEDERSIVRGLRRVINAGIRPKDIQFYVLIGFDTTPEDDIYRVEKLKEFGPVSIYVMAYDKTDPYQRAFQTYVNSRSVHKKIDFKDFDRRIEYQERLIRNNPPDERQMELFA